MSGNCCYYACNNNFTNDIDKATFINITAGPIWGMTPMNPDNNIEIIGSNMRQGERGSIINNAHINRIQVENIVFKGYGSISCDSIIFDSNEVHQNSRCQCSSSCVCSDDSIQAGCPKSFRLGVPPGVESFVISVVCYRNFKYGGFNDGSLSDETDIINTKSSYQELYRFSWWIDITRSGIASPILALGPYVNFHVGSDRLIESSSSSSSNPEPIDDDDASSLNLTDSLSRNVNIKSGQQSSRIRPFYVATSGTSRNINSSLSDNLSNFAAGSNTSNVMSNNMNLGIPNMNSGDAPLINQMGFSNGQMGPTLCASFCLSSRDKKNSSDGNLMNLLRNCDGCLTLFVPCPRID